MANRKQRLKSSNGAEIIILNEKDGVKDTTRRPLTGERLKRAQELVAKIEQSRQLAEKHAKKNGSTEKSNQEDRSITELE